MLDKNKNELRSQVQSSGTRFLDGVRGLAALYVLVFHARWLLWEGFAEGFVQHPERYSLPAKAVAYASLAFYYGHQAVILFFVLSGFVIHLRYAKAQVSGIAGAQDQRSFEAFGLRGYLIRRIRRIFPVLIFALAITYGLDTVGRSLGYAVYPGQTRYSLINAVGSEFGAARLLAGLALIPGAPEWGSNLPLWSLRYEWFFYLLYPALWLIRRRSLFVATALILLLCLLTFARGLWAWPLGGPLRLTFSLLIIWWFGALLAECYVKAARRILRRVAPLSLLIIPLLFSVEPFIVLDETVRDILWGVAFTGFLAWLLSDYAGAPVRAARRSLERVAWLGSFSYTLYAIHFPILFFLSGFLISRSADGSLPADYPWIIAGSGLCLVVASVAARLVEVPFTAHRAREGR